MEWEEGRVGKRREGALDSTAGCIKRRAEARGLKHFTRQHVRVRYRRNRIGAIRHSALGPISSLASTTSFAPKARRNGGYGAATYLRLATLELARR